MHTKSLSWTGQQSHVLQHFDYPATLTERGPLVWQASHNKCQSAMWANQLLKMFLISCFWLEPHRGEQLAGVPVLLVAAGHATLQYASFFHQLGSKYSAYDGKIQSTGNSQWQGRQPPWAQLAPDQVQDQVVQSVDAPPETATKLMAVGGWVTEGADNFFSVLILLLCVFSQTLAVIEPDPVPVEDTIEAAVAEDTSAPPPPGSRLCFKMMSDWCLRNLQPIMGSVEGLCWGNWTGK